MSLKRVMVSCVLLLAFGGCVRAEGQYVVQTFEKKVLSDLFFSEGAGYGDFNHDGKMDIVSGPFWYEGPDYKVKHQFFEDKDAKPFDPHNYSKNFFAWGYDFNGDGWDDILIYGFPGEDASWYENPKGKDGPWVRHKVVDVVDNESPWFIDINGDGKPDICCNSKGFFGWYEADWKDAAKPWTFHPISPKSGWQRFTHGMGVGDVNGDGKLDILEANGWWEQPADLKGDPVWKLHPAKFGNGAQIYAYDLNGDGVNAGIAALPLLVRSVRPKPPPCHDVLDPVAIHVHQIDRVQG